jgi:hypothetical protein
MTSLVPSQAAHAAPRGLLAGFGPAFTFGVRLAAGRTLRLVLVGTGAVAVGLLAGRLATRVAAGAHDPGAAVWQLWELLRKSLLPMGLPLVAVLLVAGAFQREVSQRTLVFHLVRPIARHTLFLARFASALLVALPVALVTPWLAVVASDLGLPGSVGNGVLLAAATGLWAYGAVALLLGALLRHGMIASLVYMFVLDPLFAESSGTLQRFSVLHHVLSVFHGSCDAAFSAASPQVASAVKARLEPPPMQGMDLTALLQGTPLPWTETPVSVGALLLFGALALVLGMRLVAGRDYPLKD